ncbi:MAG TPA: hypothetical protein VGW33_08895 [Terriglobia bacterium]|nr:hypothetical protein [Terriglobia bacterium]
MRIAAQSAVANGATLKSNGLEWLWQHLRDVPRPRLLDCGPARRATVEVLLRRGSTLHVADLISPVERGDPELWDRARKAPVFRTEVLLAQIPPIPAASLSAIFCWQLLDLLPRDALAAVVLHLYLYLEPNGVLFCLLRDPHLATGVEPHWWLESLATMGRDDEGTKPFPHPALTNREMEGLIPTGSVKTFLTRSGWREFLAIK